MATRSVRSKNAFYAAMILIGGLVMVPLGWSDAEDQAGKLSGHVQTNAVILSGSIREVQDDDGTEYCPSLRYRYVVADRWVESGQATPLGNLDCESSRARAEAVLRNYPPGRQMKAYSDPSHPSQVFLIRERSVKPYVLMLVGMALLALGLWLLDIRPRRPQARRWVWGLYSLAGALVLVHELASGAPGWTLSASGLIWLAHSCVPALFLAEPWDLSED